MSVGAEVVAPSHRRRAALVAWTYGVICHIAFAVAVATMMVGLLSGMRSALGRVPSPWAYAANAVLLVQFPLLHSALLSRRGHGLLKRLAPFGLGANLASTTYALIASLQTGLLFLAWTPSANVVWKANGATYAIMCLSFVAAWLLLLKAIVDAGLALQTGSLGWRAVVRGQRPAYPPMPTRGLFRVCRQPIYVAFALTLWTPPTITRDGLAIAIPLTVYCLVGPVLKEVRFARRFGPAFARYRAEVPYWLPWPRLRRRAIRPGAE